MLCRAAVIENSDSMFVFLTWSRDENAPEVIHLHLPHLVDEI